MKWMKQLFSRRGLYGDLSEEIQEHLEEKIEELVAGGMSRKEAAYVARREFGNVTLIEERGREVWQWPSIEDLVADVRYGLRVLRKNPGFTATAVLSLALGIGANTAIFSLMDALMLRWLPVSDPQGLALLKMQPAGAKSPFESFSYPIVHALAEQREIFAGLAGFSGSALNVGSPGSVTRVPGAWVTGGYYETLGLNPVVGRLLTRDDDQPGAPLVAVISYGYWERQFVQDPRAIGQTLRLNGVPVEIIGISPPGFVGANVGSIADITMPVAALPRVDPNAAPLLGAGNFWLRVLARPKAGVPTPEVKSRLASVWPGISERVIRPDWPPARRRAMADVTFEFASGGTGYTRLRETFRKPLLVVMGVVALVLLIACANVANLLLARAAARQREIAVRLAIGAGRGRIVRQLLTESALLSLIGAAFGIGLAWLFGRFLVDIISSGPMQVVFDLTPNWHVLGFTTAVAVAAGILFGLAPAFQATAQGSSPVLKEDARMSGSRSRVLSTLVSVQVAISLLLVIGAGLFVRTLQNLQNLDPGFRREGVLLVNFEGRRTGLPKELLNEVQRVPGVMSASVSTHTPLSGSTWSEPAVPKGQALPENDNAYFIGAGPGFFETMQTGLLSGREFTERDTGNNRAVAVVNEAYARRHFPNENPVGQFLSAVVRGQPKELEIVGVVRNANLAGLRVTPPPTVYVSYFQLTGDFPTTLEIRASGSLGQVALAIQKELQPRLPDAPVEVQALSVQVSAAIVQERMMATLAGGFGALALILACVGLYGLLAYSVARRTKEMGIRMALGARRGRLMAMVIKNAIRLVVFGIALGLPAAWAASRLVKSMLFGLTSTDPTTIAGSALLLTIAALLAAYLPAWRASRIDPMVALRHE
jgi:predicted permease